MKTLHTADWHLREKDIDEATECLSYIDATAMQEGRLMKTLHTADWHLREKDIDEATECLSYIDATAMQEKVDLVIIAGDIFDSQDIKLDSKTARLAIQAISALADIAPVAIVLGTPSHDGRSPEILRYAKGVHPIEVADTPIQLPPFYFPTVDAIITLIPAITKQYWQSNSNIEVADQEIGQAMSALFAGFGVQAAPYSAPHILIHHGGVAGAKASNGQLMTGRDIEVNFDQIMMANPDLVCLGHLHLPQQVGDRGYYSGSIYANNVGENHKHGFYIHEVDALGLTSRFIETPAKKMSRISFDYTVGEITGIDANVINGVKGTFARLDYKVWQDDADKIDKGAIMEIMKAAGALDVDIRIVRVPRQNVRSEAVLKADRLRDKIQKMAELKEEDVEWSILAKADSLEDMTPDELMGSGGLTT